MNFWQEPRTYGRLFLQALRSKAMRFLHRDTEAVLVSLGGEPFLIAPDDMEVGRAVRRYDGYEDAELALISTAATEDSAVLFVGAHAGAHVVRIAPRVRSVTAVEANPDSYRLLEMNCRLRRLDNVKCWHFAAMDRIGPVKFLQNRANSGGAKIAPVRDHYFYGYDKPAVVTVHGDRLDDRLSGNRFDVIVMDIEGAEYFALKGMQGMLATSQFLFVEFIPHHLENVSGVSVPAFLSQITPHFSHLYLPGQEERLPISMSEAALERMSGDGTCASAIVFSKNPWPRAGGERGRSAPIMPQPS